MRKSLALALALVFAFASVSLAATPTFNAEFSATARHDGDGRFFGQYGITRELSLTVGLKSEQENWDATFSLTGKDTLGVALGRYTVNVNEDAFKFTAWGGDTSGSIGNLGDALDFLTVGGAYAQAPKFRLTTNLGGVDAALQVNHNSDFYANGKMGFDQFTLGATVYRNLNDANPGAEYNSFAVYGGASLDVVNVDAAFYSNGKHTEDNTAIGVKASSDITEQLNVYGQYVSAAANSGKSTGYKLGGTFTEGVIQAAAEYNRDDTAKKSGAEVSVVYRGSEDNVAFGDLFKADQYYKNVAPAVRLTYKVETPDEEKATTTITVQGTAPVVADQLWVLGRIEAKSNEDGIKTEVPVSDAKAGSITTVALEGYAPYGKLTFIPSITSTSYSKVEHGPREGGYSTFAVDLDVEYAVASDVTLSFGIGQSTGNGSGDFSDVSNQNRYTKFGVTVSF